MPQFTGAGVSVGCWHDDICTVSKLNHYIPGMHWLEVGRREDEWHGAYCAVQYCTIRDDHRIRGWYNNLWSGHCWGQVMSAHCTSHSNVCKMFVFIEVYW